MTPNEPCSEPCSRTGDVSSHPDVGGRGARRGSKLGSRRRRTLDLPTSPSRCQPRTLRRGHRIHPTTRQHQNRPTSPHHVNTWSTSVRDAHHGDGECIPPGRATCRVSGLGTGCPVRSSTREAGDLQAPREERASGARPAARDRWNETRLTTGVLRFWGGASLPGNIRRGGMAGARATHSPPMAKMGYINQ